MNDNHYWFEDDGRTLWNKAVAEKGVDHMRRVRDQERHKCQSKIIRIGIHYYVKVWIGLDHPDFDIEEMARIGGKDPDELQESLEYRASRLSALLQEKYVNLPKSS